MTREPPVSTALLLAAGAGTRLNTGAEAMPKCLADVGGQSILERLFNTLRVHGIRRLVIVTGYRGERIRDAADQIAGDIQVDYVDNPDYATTNNIYSLWLARAQVRESFLLIESDLVFERGLLGSMLTPDKAAVSEILPWMNGTTVRLDDRLQRVESFDLAGSRDAPGSFKTVNIYSLSLNSWDTVVARLEEHILAGRINSYYEVVFFELVAENALQFGAVVFPNDRWYEIDTPAEQRAANQLLAAWSAD